jgi:hypothetical protein
MPYTTAFPLSQIHPKDRMVIAKGGIPVKKKNNGKVCKVKT